MNETTGIVFYGGTGGVSTTYTINTPTVAIESKSKKDKEGNNLPARIYFKLIKSKLTTLDKDKLTKRISKIQMFLDKAVELQQQVLQEHLIQLLATAVSQQELLVLGCDTIVNKKYVDLFLEKHKDAKLDSIAIYGKAIPDSAAKKIAYVSSLKVFHEIKILFLDPNYEKSKTVEQKIVEKDPIAFGVLAYDPNNYYFITDWVDDYCDLTLDKLVDFIRGENQHYVLKKIPSLSPSYLNLIKGMALEDATEIAKVTRENWRKRHEERKEQDVKRQKVLKKKKVTLLDKINEKVRKLFNKKH